MAILPIPLYINFGFAQFKKGNAYLNSDFGMYEIEGAKNEEEENIISYRIGRIYSGTLGGFVQKNVSMGLMFSYEPFYTRYSS